MWRTQIESRITWILTGAVAVLAACTGGSSDSITVAGDVAIVYVKRPVQSLGNPTDAVVTGQGGDLFMRDKSSPSGTETNLTASFTNGQGDVAHPEVSFDGTKVVFAMHRPSDANWGIWEYDTASKSMRPIVCDATVQGDDTEPAYLPDGRIVFISNRQETTKRQMQAAGTAQGLSPASYTYVDEYDREQTAVLHVMNSDGGNCHQISFDQSHDRNPTVLSTGEILYSRWDHVGDRNQFTIFKVNPDGTNLFVVYGAHSPGNSYMHPREMSDGHLMATLMPLSRTREGGSLEIIDYKNYSEINEPGDNAPLNLLGQQAGQVQVEQLLFPGAPQSQLDPMRNGGVSPLGRYRNPYPLWDGTNRVLVAFTPSQPTPGTDPMGNPTTVEGTPKYGIYMLDLGSKTLRPVIPPQDGFFLANPVPLQPRPKPAVIGQFTPDSSIPAGFGLFDVHTVYDTDDKQRMGDAVLAAGESIARVAGQPDIANLSTPGTPQYASRVARFFRITKAVPTPSGMSREALGETEFEMQQIVGYGVVEPDGSIRAHVPADTAINITVLDANGRQFIEHTHWIQAREGERRFCKGCHSARLTTTSPNPGTAASMAETRAADTVNNPGYSNLGGSPIYTDYWTPVLNAQNGTSFAPQAPISITYSGLSASPVKGPTSCATAWSAKDCAIVINFPDHIQPILTAKCASCHSGLSAAAGLDLSATTSGEFGRTAGYQSLMVGPPLLDANGDPIITINDEGEFMIARETPPVTPGGARGGRLIERVFEQPLLADASSTTQRAFCRAGGASCFNGATYVNHTTIASPLTPAEKRVITEWADIGGTYFNDPYNGTTLRSAAAQLSETVFACKVQPILQSTCASCHQAFGGNGSSSGPANPNFVANRFVLTGNTPADFGVTATMVTNIAAPDSSLLLLRPSRAITDTPPHPGATPVLPSASTDYATIKSWIAGTLTCQ
jgi:Hydrazine synthase alpha subunit middle domain/WD40-like Beta Propeller Repeat